MQLNKYLALAAITASMAASAQQTDSSIFDLLTAPNNTLGVSKFVGLINSDPAFQPVIDLLKQSGNHTAFIPNDRFLSRVIPLWKLYAKKHNLNVTGDYPPADFSLNNVTVLDIVSYHVANDKINLDNLAANTEIIHSILNDTKVDKLGTGLPIQVQSNATTAQLANQTWVEANGKYLEYEVGNGVHDTDVQYKNLEANNGFLNVIESVMIPPMDPTVVIAEDSDLKTLSRLLKDHPAVADLLNSSNNFTFFAPNDDALKKVNFKGMTNETIENLIKTHIVPGVYYSTNFTADAAANNGAVDLTSTNNVSFPVSVNSTTGAMLLNNTIRFDEPNEFFNNGVMHVIKGVLNAPAM